jgi:hypothetical protein
MLNFPQQAVPVSNDELTAFLQELNAPTPFVPAPAEPRQVEGGTKAGVDRVNANSSNTGVGGYIDANGRASFTQVRDASTGQPIQPQVPALFKPFGTPQNEAKECGSKEARYLHWYPECPSAITKC